MQRRFVKGYSRAGLLTGYGKDVVGVMVHTAAVVCAQAHQPDNNPYSKRRSPPAALPNLRIKNKEALSPCLMKGLRS